MSYFTTKFSKSHLVHFNTIIHFCHCLNTLLCNYQHVMQITHFHIWVQKYDTTVSLVLLISCLLSLPANLWNFAKLKLVPHFKITYSV